MIVFDFMYFVMCYVNSRLFIFFGVGCCFVMMCSLCGCMFFELSDCMSRLLLMCFRLNVLWLLFSVILSRCMFCFVVNICFVVLENDGVISILMNCFVMVCVVVLLILWLNVMMLLNVEVGLVWKVFVYVLVELLLIVMLYGFVCLMIM